MKIICECTRMYIHKKIPTSFSSCWRNSTHEDTMTFFSLHFFPPLLLFFFFHYLHPLTSPLLIFSSFFSFSCVPLLLFQEIYQACRVHTIASYQHIVENDFSIRFLTGPVMDLAVNEPWYDESLYGVDGDDDYRRCVTRCMHTV